MEPAIKIRSILIPVEDLDGALAWMTSELGCAIRFRDGDRYVELDASGQSLALVAQSERLVDRPALSVRTEDLNGAIDALQRRGSEVVQAPVRGPHETRAVLKAPGDVLLVLSSKQAQQI
jgi:hypothetical protein